MITIKKFTPTSHKVKALVYGPSGAGKTSFAGGAEDCLFLSAEGGLLSIADKNPDYVEIKSKEDLESAYRFLSDKTKHSYKTVIIDSITEINEIIKIHIEKKAGRSMQMQDWGTLAKQIRGILSDFRNLDMNVLFIAQETAEDKDEDGKIGKRVPSLNGKAATEIAYFMDIVGYIFIDKFGKRQITTNPRADLLTKDRTRVIGLSEIDEVLGFQAWINKAQSIKIGTEKVVGNFSNEDSQEPPKKEDVIPNAVNKSLYNLMLSKVKETTKENYEDRITKIKQSTSLTVEEIDLLVKAYTDFYNTTIAPTVSEPVVTAPAATEVLQKPVVEHSTKIEELKSRIDERQKEIALVEAERKELLENPKDTQKYLKDVNQKSAKIRNLQDGLSLLLEELTEIESTK